MRNIGRIGNVEETTNVEEASFASSTYSQVYDLTHDSNGNRLSNISRSYLSFSFGGKWIEDWNLIVTYSDRMERKTSADFEDLTTDYDVVDGMFYWGTYFKNNTISFTLSTDGITQDKLEDFKNWFAPGEMHELILAEHPNRAIMARISSAPELSVIPFEKDVEIKILNQTYLVPIANYKGEITIEFTMDSPFWYAKEKVITNNFSLPDNLKIMLEDNIPCKEMIQHPTFLGNTIYDEGGSVINTISIPSGNANLNTHPLIYYGGTAPCKPTIGFTLHPQFNSNSYITSPTNTFVSQNKTNYLRLSETNEQIMYLSCPSVYLSYNRAISIFNDNYLKTFDDLRHQITKEINHIEMRKLALHFINYLDNFVFNDTDDDIEIPDEIIGEDNDYGTNNNGTGTITDLKLTNEHRTKLELLMRSTIQRNSTLPIQYNISGEYGNIRARIGYLTIADYPIQTGHKTKIRSYFSSTDYNRWMHDEDISDIIQSPFLVLKERNSFSSEGVINYNINNNYITHNFSIPLENFTIEYNYLYY